MLYLTNKLEKEYYKLYSTYNFTTSRLILINQVALESFKEKLFIHILS